MKKMKRFISIVLALTLIIGCCNVIPTFATNAQAETADEEFVLLGNNDALSWQTCSADLESQTIEFGASVKVKKLRLYVTDLFGASYIIREFEALDKNGTNMASDGYNDCNVTITSNLANASVDDLPDLCNGYGGYLGYTDSDSWDQFKYNAASTTEYIEFEFPEAVELSAVRIWATWCNDPSWGNAPERWQVTGLVETTASDELILLGDNSNLSWEQYTNDADEAAAKYQSQEIAFAESVMVSKLRLKVTDIYNWNKYIIHEFEVLDENGNNLLIDSATRQCNATISIVDGMPNDANNPIENLCDGYYGSDYTWSKYTYTGIEDKSVLQDEYIEFTFDKPVIISAVRIWCTYCSKTDGGGDAPKSWEIYGDRCTYFSQNFTENSDISAWSVNEGSAVWETRSYGDGTWLTNGDVTGSGIISAGNTIWADYTVSADIVITGKEVSPGLLFRYQDTNNFYMFLYSPTDSLLRLYKRSGGTYTVLRDVKKELGYGNTYNFKVTVQGSRIVCMLDNEPTIVWSDNTFSTGKIGARIYKTSTDVNAYYNNFSVSKVFDIDMMFCETFDTYDTNIWGDGDGDKFSTMSSQALQLGGSNVSTNWLISASDGITSAGNTVWTNYEIMADIKMQGKASWNCPGLLFRYQDTNNFYLMHVDKYGKEVALLKRTNGSYTKLASKKYVIPEDGEMQYKVHVYDDVITCYIDGVTVLQYTDTANCYTSGKIGFRSYVNNQPDNYSMIDNILVRKVIAEAEITDIFFDDFSGNLSKWDNTGTFSLTNGTVVPVGTGETVMYVSNTTLTECRLETELNGISGQMGLTTHYTEGGSYYRVIIDKSSDMVMLYKGAEVIAERKWPIGESAVLAITFNSNKLSVWIDEIKMMDYTDNEPISSGRFGLYAKGSTGAFESVGAYSIDVADILPGDYPYEPTPEPIKTVPITNTFYVAENGSDDWAGTFEKPFASIERAREAVQTAKSSNPNCDYTVIIRGGVYYLDETINMSSADGGTGDYRVTYAAYQDETPIISGGKEVSGTWAEYENGVWVTTLSDEFADVDIRQLFVENVRATRSREPDIGETDNSVTEDGYWNVESIDTTNYMWLSPEGEIPDTWSSLAGVEMNTRGTWHYNRQMLESFDTENNIAYSENYIGCQASSLKVNPDASTWQGKDWVYFENALLFVDTPGEWFYDEESRQLYYYPEDNLNPNELKIVIPVLEKLITVTGTRENPAKNIDFHGIRFCHTTWIMPEGIERRTTQAGEYGTTTDQPFYMPSAALMFENTCTSRIQECDFTMLGEGGVAFAAGANSNLIYDCTFTDVGANSIMVGYRSNDSLASLHSDWPDDSDAPRGNEIVHNYFNNCATTDLSCVAIWVGQANHTLVEHNTIKNMPYTGISVGFRWSTGVYSAHHNKILSNYVENIMTKLGDGAGIYVVGEQYNNKILSNYVTDSDGTGIYFDECTRYTETAYNYITDTRNGKLNYHTIYQYELDIHDNYIDITPNDISEFGCLTGELGDVNYDASVDILDLVRIKKYIANTTIKIDKIVADIDSDGTLKNGDIDGLRELLVKPEDMAVMSYNSQIGLLLTDGDLLEKAVLSTNVATSDNVIPELIHDGTQRLGYNSATNNTVFPEVFTFTWDSEQTGKVLRLTANYASKQAPTDIEVLVQTEAGWQRSAKCNIIWDSTVDEWQYVDILIDAIEITGIKVIVTNANLTWNKYTIAEMEFLTEDDLY